MSKITKNRWVKITTALATLASSSKLSALELQSKIKNADKSDFNTISSPFKKPLGQYSIIGEVSDTKQPLILRQANGTNKTLIEGLQAFELSFLHELTDNIQIGILVPGERPYGLIGPYNEAKNYLSNILIEPKVYISNDVALIPVYYVPVSNSTSLLINNQPSDLELGYPDGAYGLKLSVGKRHDNGIKTAYQIGAIIAPSSKFKDIDQSMKLQFGGGVSKELSGGLKLLAEAYGEKYKSSSPLEALAMIEYSNDKFMVRFGGGTGDVQGSGSNTTRMLANFSYYFDTKKETTQVEPVALSNKPLDPKEYETFKKKVETTEDKILDEEVQKIEERLKNLPEEPQSKKPENKLPLVSVLISKKEFQSVMDGQSDETNLSVLKDLSNKEFESLFDQEMDGKSFKEVVLRSIASANDSLLARLEDVFVTPTAILEIKKRDFHWSEPKAKYVLLNLKRANLNIKDNIDLYKKLEKEGKDLTKAINEINWGLRVFKRNLNSWNMLTASYMAETNQSIDRLEMNNSIFHQNYTTEAMELIGKSGFSIDNEIKTAQSKELLVAQEYVVNVISKLNIRKTPEVLLTNVAGQLTQGDIVRPMKNELFNNYVQVEVVNSKSFKNSEKIEPLYVHFKYLTLKVQEPSLNLTETTVDKSSLMDDVIEVSKINHQNQSQMQNVKDIFEIIQNVKKSPASSEITEESVPLMKPEAQSTVDINQSIAESKKEVVDSVINNEKEKQTEIVVESSLPLKKKKENKASAKKLEIVSESKNVDLPEKEVKSEVISTKASKIEIVYDEPVVEIKSPKIIKKKAKQLVEKKVVVEVMPETKVESSIIEEAPKVIEQPVIVVESQKIEPVVASTEIKKVVEPSKEEKIKKELEAIDKIIEMKSNPENKPTNPVEEVVSKKEESPAVVEVKKEEPKVVVEVKDEKLPTNVMDQVIQKKTIELKNQNKSNTKETDPSKVEPLMLEEEFPMEETQKGPKF